jgi:hypothetical protein
METLRIEQFAMIRLATAAGSAVQIDRRQSTCAPGRFDIQLVTVADRHHLRR